MKREMSLIGSDDSPVKLGKKGDPSMESLFLARAGH